eukprot:SM003704S13651  [mRNA]  locus=s3704:444:1367:- [translate_table: standard]
MEAQRAEKDKRLKLRTLGNIRLIGELFKQAMIPEKIVHACVQELLGERPADAKAAPPPPEENLESLCHLLNTAGKALDGSAKSKTAMDAYFRRVKEYAADKRLNSRTRFMCRDLLELRSNQWVPRREEVKAKKLDAVHAEAEAKLGLRPGTLASTMRAGNAGGTAASATARNGPDILFPPR